MAEGELKGYILTFLFFALFSFLLLSWIDDMGVLHSVDTSEIGRGSLDPESFNNSLQPLNSSAQAARKSFSEGDFLDLDSATSIFEVIKDVFEFMFTPIDLLGKVLQTVLGVPALVTQIIFVVIISIIFVFEGWRVLKTGS